MKKLPRQYKYKLAFAVFTALAYTFQAFDIDATGFIIGGVMTIIYAILDICILKGDKRNENN